MQKVGFITTFLHSINATRESNENGRFSPGWHSLKCRFSRYYRNFRGKKTRGVFTFTEAYLYTKVGRI